MAGTDTKYIIDTCSLTAMRRIYPRDVFPGAWGKLDDLADSGVLRSVENVLAELEAQDDEVLEWAKRHREIFYELDENVQQEAARILVSHSNLVDLRRRKSEADPFVIGCAMVYGGAVVTEEKKSGGPDRPKIPDVCEDIGVEWFGVLEMLRREELRL